MVSQYKPESSGFVRRYWRGQIPVDGVFFTRGLLTLFIFYGIQVITIWLLLYITSVNMFISILVDLLAFLVILSVLTWFVVGALRSARTIAANKSISGAGYIYGGGLIISIIVFAFYVTPHYKMTLFEPMDEYVHLVIYGELPSFDKSITSRINDEEIQINGRFEIGLAKEVARYFEKYPDIRTVKLNSDGGSMLEGEKLYALFKSKSVTTYTTTGCASACTFAFMGGEKRLMQGRDKLGFHSSSNYAIRRMSDTKYGLLMNVINFRLGAGVDCVIYGNNEEFCGKVKATPWYEVWRPTVKELVYYDILTDHQEAF